MSRNRSDSGEFVESVTLAAVVEVFNEVEGPVVTSGDVADTLGCSRETARRKLTELHEKGRVSRRKTAGRVVWWRTDSERSRGGSAEPLRELVGLVDDEGAERVKKRSREFREEFNDRMDTRRTDRAEE
jgi:predicted ArsR family transcriptional regulator